MRAAGIPGSAIALLAMAGVVAMVAMVACATGPLQREKETAMSLEPDSSNSRIMVDVPEILFEGKRYEQVVEGDRDGEAQRTGLMRVVDLQTGTSSVVQVYDERRDPDLEEDAGDVFFTSFELDGQRRVILIENERGERYEYDIDGKTVTAAR